MLGLFVSVPIACFRPGAAREFWETHPLPPPATVYGFLLAMVGETDRAQHLGARVTAGLLNQPDRSTILRKMWRIKELDKRSFARAGNGSNVRPDFQQLLTGIRLLVYVDSADEVDQQVLLEDRIAMALDPARRNQVVRFGGLSLGESTHMVDEVSPIDSLPAGEIANARVFLNVTDGNLTLPVWVDHVGAAGTRYSTGRLETNGKKFPERDRLPIIDDGSILASMKNA